MSNMKEIGNWNTAILHSYLHDQYQRRKWQLIGSHAYRQHGKMCESREDLGTIEVCRNFKGLLRVVILLEDHNWPALTELITVHANAALHEMIAVT